MFWVKCLMGGEGKGRESEDKRGVCVQAQCRKQGLLFSTPTTPTPYAPQCARERGTRAALVRVNHRFPGDLERDLGR